MKPQILYASAAGEIAVGEAAAGAPAIVVADFAEEAYLPLQLPRAGWRDRVALVTRRLAQEFPETSYRLALPLPRGAMPNGYTHVLAALPEAPLAALAERLDAQRRELVGVWSVALAASWWLQQSRCAEPRALVVIRTPAGVRHVLLVHGRPVLSRLVLEELTGETALDPVRELERTVQYLRNARWLAADERLAAFWWGEPLPAAAPAAARGALRWMSTPRLPGLPDPAEQGLAALAALLARRRPRTQFAPPAALAAHRARRLARATVVAGALTAALLAAVGLQQTLAARALAAQRAAIDGELAAVRAELARAHEALRQAGIDAQALHAALQAHERFGSAVQPAPALRRVAQALADVTALRVDELAWEAAGGATADAADAACGAETQDKAIRVRLRGDTRELPWRTIDAERERFERRLRAQPGVALHAERAPLALAQAPLRGGGDAPRTLPFAYCVRFGGGA